MTRERLLQTSRGRLPYSEIEQYPAWIIDGQRHTEVVNVERPGQLSHLDWDATAQETEPEGQEGAGRQAMSNGQESRR